MILLLFSTIFFTFALVFFGWKFFYDLYCDYLADCCVSVEPFINFMLHTRWIVLGLTLVFILDIT